MIMMISHAYRSRTDKALMVVVALLGLALFCAPSKAQAAPKYEIVSTPQITTMLEPYTPGGQMRLYTVAGGTSYWTRDLPIYVGDQVKLDVFVATGSADLQVLKVRLDNNLIATLDKAPWTTTLNTSTLGSGYHFVEAWAQVSEPKPQFATHTITFFVSPAPAASVQSTGIQPAPVTQVQGQEQILQNGHVTNVPLDVNPNAARDSEPPLPSFLATTSQDPAAKVDLSLTDQTTKTAINPAEVVPVAGPVLVTTVPLAGSTATKFAYSITRDNQAVYVSPQAFAADTTDVRLQPRTATSPGLLQGRCTLWFWGVDRAGNYGPVTELSVDVQGSSGG